MRTIFILLLSVLLIVGCSSSPSDNSKDAKGVSVDNNSNDLTNENAGATKGKNKDNGKLAGESTDGHDDADDEKKQTNKYIQLLDDLKKELEPVREKAKDGTQEEMDKAVDELYERWDVALNEIYDALERELSDKDMETLRKEQRKWIEKRDEYAEKEASDYKGDTLYGFTLTEAKKEFTKDRCYELVEDYID